MIHNLFVKYYTSPSEERQKELDFCLDENCNCFDNIILFIDYETKSEIYYLLDNNKKNNYNIYQKDNVTFTDYFDLINLISPEDRIINVVANLDIVFTKETLIEAEQYFKTEDKTCLALTRYNVGKYKGIKFHNRKDSQDCWVFKGEVKDVPPINFGTGISGSDNALAHILEQAGYNVINPSLTLKTYHYHNSGIRNKEYTEKRVPKPYKLLPPRSPYLP